MAGTEQRRRERRPHLSEGGPLVDFIDLGRDLKGKDFERRGEAMRARARRSERTITAEGEEVHHPKVLGINSYDASPGKENGGSLFKLLPARGCGFTYVPLSCADHLG
jgi:hypothetical protein